VGSFQLPHIRCKTDEERKEELRLAYVAVTRARDHLVCSYPESLPNGAEQDPCPFFPEDSPWQCYDEDGRPRPRRQVQRGPWEYEMSH
jgi:superfamily I DNA/RNA helicase